MDTFINLSVVKREKFRKEENKRKLEEMRASLPVYSLKEIERYRLPYHLALCSQIEEEGFPTAAAFITHLIEFQEGIRLEFGKDSSMWYRPRLKECKNELKMLQAGLCRAEQSHYDDNFAEECNHLIQLAVQFAFDNHDWMWLGEQLLIQAISVSSAFSGSGGKHEALSRFLYAKFLIENIGKSKIAKELLIKTRELSNGRNWSAKSFLPTADKTIYIESSLLLHENFLYDARKVMKTDSANAIRLAVQAKKKATEACYYEGQVQSLILKGLCELILDNELESFINLCQAFSIKLKKEVNCPAYIGKMYKGLECLKKGERENGLKHLMEIEQTIDNEKLPYHILQIYRYLAEYNLKYYDPAIATPLFLLALNQLYKGRHFEDLDETRCFAAVSTGYTFNVKV